MRRIVSENILNFLKGRVAMGETSLYKIGDKVIASGLGKYREGYVFTITGLYVQGGYVYYEEKESVHRQKDIKEKVAQP